MAIVYDKLFETMKKKNITTYILLKNGFSTATLNRFKYNRNITTETINKLCKLLKCQPSEIMEYIEENEQ